MSAPLLQTVGVLHEPWPLLQMSYDEQCHGDEAGREVLLLISMAYSSTVSPRLQNEITIPTR